MIARIDMPWWGRPPLAIGLGAVLGAISAAFVGSPAAKLLTLGPAFAAANILLADVGRRAASWRTAAFSALAMLFLSLFQGAGTAIALTLLGGLIAARLVEEGTHRANRMLILFGMGAAVCPIAAILAYRFTVRMDPGQPLVLGVAAFQAFYWLPVAALDAALAWSAARARPARSAGAKGLEEALLRELMAVRARVEAEREERAGGTGGGEPREAPPGA